MDKESKIIPLRRDGSPHFMRELANHVEKSWDLTSQDAVTNELWAAEFKAFLDGQTLKSLFFSEDWVFIIVDLIANKISSQPLKVMQSRIEGEQEIIESDPENPLNALLEQPNQWQDYSSWMYQTIVELFLMGNAVIWSANKSGQLITLQTENVNLEFDNVGQLKRYMLTNFAEDDTGFRSVEAVQSFDPKEIMHVRRPNPSSLLWGLSPFVPGRKSILFNRYSQDYLNAFYLKQATPGLALSLDRQVNEDVALRQLRSFEVAYQGRKNMRRTLILPKGVSAQTLTHSLSDQKLIEHIDKNRETILGILKVPKHELSLQSAGSLGSEEHKMALRNFWESTLIPAMRMVEGVLTKHFQNELGENGFFQFDLSEVEALKDDMKKKAEVATQMLQAGLSINEVREQVWKVDPSDAPGAYEPYVLASRPAMPQFSLPDVLAPGEEEEVQDEEPEQKMQTKIQVTDDIERIRMLRTKQLDEEEGRTIKGFASKLIDMLVGMTEAALDVIEGSDKTGKIRQVKELPSSKILERRIERALTDLFEETYLFESARTLSTSIDLGYNQQLEIVFNQEAKREIEALRARDEEGRRQILEERGLDSFAQITRTHTERIMREITKGQAENESITDIMRRVANSLGTPGQLAGKAEMIARTETLTAVSIGQAAAVDNAKEVIPGLKKAWLTAGDDRVRDSHAALDGDVIGVDEKFDNGLRHPRDIKSSDPAEVIQCRCTLLLIPPDEE